MLLPVACRYLLKAYNQVTSGQKLSGSAAYLSGPIEKKCSLTAALDVQALVRAYQHRAHM